jgi:hypothetical protein
MSTETNETADMGAEPETRGLVRVYRVKTPHFGDYIADSWDAAIGFLATECEPEDTDPEWDGHEATITSEHMTRAEIDALPEWSP